MVTNDQNSSSKFQSIDNVVASYVRGNFESANFIYSIGSIGNFMSLIYLTKNAVEKSDYKVGESIACLTLTVGLSVYAEYLNKHNPNN